MGFLLLHVELFFRPNKNCFVKFLCNNHQMCYTSIQNMIMCAHLEANKKTIEIKIVFLPCHIAPLPEPVYITRIQFLYLIYSYFL